MKAKKSADRSHWVSGEHFQFTTPKPFLMKESRRKTTHGRVTTWVHSKQSKSEQKFKSHTPNFSKKPMKINFTLEPRNVRYLRSRDQKQKTSIKRNKGNANEQITENKTKVKAGRKDSSVIAEVSKSNRAKKSKKAKSPQSSKKGKSPQSSKKGKSPQSSKKTKSPQSIKKTKSPQSSKKGKSPQSSKKAKPHTPKTTMPKVTSSLTKKGKSPQNNDLHSSPSKRKSITSKSTKMASPEVTPMKRTSSPSRMKIPSPIKKIKLSPENNVTEEYLPVFQKDASSSTTMKDSFSYKKEMEELSKDNEEQMSTDDIERENGRTQTREEMFLNGTDESFTSSKINDAKMDCGQTENDGPGNQIDEAAQQSSSSWSCNIF